MIKLFEFLSEILYPQNIKCVFCGKDLPKKVPTNTCPDCLENLPFAQQTKTCLKCGDKVLSLAEFCDICQSKNRHFDQARAPFFYEEPISFAIKKFKYENAKYLFKPLATYMANTYYQSEFNPDFIVFVPMFEKKERQRGYNQSFLLAKNLSDIVGVQVLQNYLIKIKKTKKQVELAFEDRTKNLKDAFKVTDKAKIKDKTILLIDDVLTSGATADECAKVLKKAGAKKVLVLTLARTHINNK